MDKTCIIRIDTNKINLEHESDALGVNIHSTEPIIVSVELDDTLEFALKRHYIIIRRRYDQWLVKDKAMDSWVIANDIELKILGEENQQGSLMYNFIRPKSIEEILDFLSDKAE